MLDIHKSAMYREITSQPEILARLLAKSAEIRKIAQRIGAAEKLLFVGCGDPYFAALTSRFLVESATGLQTLAMRSMDIRWFAPMLNQQTLVVACSVSGRTPRTIEAARLAAKHGAKVIALTDNPDTELTHVAAETILTETSPAHSLAVHEYQGYQNVVPQSKTYLATLLAQLMIGAAFAPAEAHDQSLNALAEAPHILTAYLSSYAESLTDLGQQLGDYHNFVVLGSGPWYGTGAYGCAKLLEFAIPARCQCIEDYNHLEIFLADEKTCIIFLAPDDRSYQRVEELIRHYSPLGSELLVISDKAKHLQPTRETIRLSECQSDWGTALLAPVPLQLLALGIAVGSGRNPDLWCGGRRTELIHKLSLSTIRGSKILSDPQG